MHSKRGSAASTDVAVDVESSHGTPPTPKYQPVVRIVLICSKVRAVKVAARERLKLCKHTRPTYTSATGRTPQLSLTPLPFALCPQHRCFGRDCCAVHRRLRNDAGKYCNNVMCGGLSAMLCSPRLHDLRISHTTSRCNSVIRSAGSSSPSLGRPCQLPPDSGQCIPGTREFLYQIHHRLLC
jgi:hypothetical protein